MRSLRGIALALLAVAALHATGPVPGAAATGSTRGARVVADTAWQDSMLAAVNRLRVGAGLRPLRLCAPLAVAATNYAHVMAARNYYGHRGPNGSQPWDRMTARGYRGKAVSENIAAGYESVTAVMRAWRRSPEHMRNILGRNYEHVGFGRSSALGSRYRTYWVQDFGGGGSCRSAG